MYDPLNLVLTQYNSKLNIRRYHGTEQTLKSKTIKNSIVKFDIILNGLSHSFSFKLNKGKNFFAHYKPVDEGQASSKVLTIEQRTFGAIIM